MIRCPKLTEVDDVWIYQNFIDSNLHNTIVLYLNNLKNETVNNDEGRHIKYNGKNYRITDTVEKNPYHLIWSLSYLPDYYDQTNETVVKWANNQYKQIMHPALRVLIEKLLSTKPFSDYPGEWVAMRGIFNVLGPNKELWPHTDGSSSLMDTFNYPTYSATYYASVEGNGGEYWDERGYVYKPVNNSLLINIGSKTLHGVRASDQYRLGISIRFNRATDLFLPGNINNFLYKPASLNV
jgi:hypothetical protein